MTTIKGFSLMEVLFVLFFLTTALLSLFSEQSEAKQWVDAGSVAVHKRICINNDLEKSAHVFPHSR